MGVEISGLDEFEKMLVDAEKRQRGAVNTFLKAEAEELLGAARDKTPVDTGALRESWGRSRPYRGIIRVGNTADYAAHVEYGYQQKKRWGPGVWKGDKFVYIEGAKTGMMLKEKVIPGVKMLNTSVNERCENLRENAKWILKEMFK